MSFDYVVRGTLCGTYYIQSKKGGDFANFLWPSQNIWTLKTMIMFLVWTVLEVFPQMRFEPIKLLLFVCNVCSFIIFEFQGSSIGFQKEILKYLALFRRNTETTRTLVLIFCLLPKRTPKKIRAYFKRPNGSPYSCDSFDPSPHFVSELS